VADYVDPREDLEVKVSAFFDKVNHPVLSDVAVDMGGVRTDLVYPRAMPDLFRGTQLVLVGRYRNDRDLRDVTLRLSGHGSGVRTYDYPGQRFPLRADENDWLPRLWATRRVGWLMEQIRSNGEQRELVQEVTELGTRYGIVTPYTSFLALEPGAVVDDREPPRPRPIIRRDRDRPVPSSGGVTPAPESMPPPPPSPMPPPPPVALQGVVVTGRDAVQQSRSAREMQEATVTGYYNSVAGEASVQRVGDKTFYLREGVWTDAEIRADTRLPETTVTFGSDEYYALLGRVPALGRYFALGERVAVIVDGRLYRVRAATR
jgi:Ca-activated chloride channel homolog